MAKLSRTGKKKHSKYQMSAKEKEVASRQPKPEDLKRERKRIRYNGIALALLSVSLVLILFGPRFNAMGIPYVAATSIAYLCTVIAGALMLYSVQFAKADRQASTKITGGLMVLVGIFGLVYTLMPLFTS